MSLCFLDGDDTREIIQFTTSHADGWIRMASVSGGGSPEPIWGFSNELQYLGYGSGARPLILTPVSVSIPDGTGFTVQRALEIDTDGQMHFQSPDASLPICFHEDTAVAFGSYGRVSSRAYEMKTTDILRLESPEMTFVATDRLRFTGFAEFIDPVRFHSNVELPSITVNHLLRIADDGQLICPEATLRRLQIHESLRLPPEASLEASGSIHLGSQTESIDLNRGEGMVLRANTSITLASPVQVPASMTVGVPGSTNADTLTLHGRLQLSSVSQTHTVAGNLEINGGFKTLSQPAEFQMGANIHRSCTIGTPHRPAEVIVYGTTHLSKSFYSHDVAYFDKTVRFHAPVQFSPNAVDKRHQPAVILPKGSMALHEGHLWINMPPIQDASVPAYTLYNTGDTMLHGNAVIHQSLTIQKDLLCQGNANIEGTMELQSSLKVMKGLSVASGGLSVASGGLRVADGGLSVASGGLRVAEGGLSVASGGLAASGGLTVDGDVSFNGNMTVLKGGLTVAEGSIQGQTLSIGGGQLECQNSVLKHKHRRYGLYEPLAQRPRWFKCLTIPYRRGQSVFYVKLQGYIFTSKHSKSFTIELGGTTAAPNIKHATVKGTLGAMESYVQFYVYQDTKTLDYFVYLELTRRAEAGFELDVEIGAGNDIFTWEASAPPENSASQWAVWWKPFETPNQHQLDPAQTAMVVMDKIGVGEKNPQYALDVRPEARFQSKIYQPFPADLIAAMGLTGAAPGGYVAITDVLSWIINKIR
jgi:hypothetical protein